MIRFLIIILIFFTICNASAEDKLYITTRYKGKIYESCITSKQYEKNPFWDPMVEKSIPLSPEKAIQLARAILEEFVPQHERLNWLLKQVELHHFDEVWPPKAYQKAGKQKWYYVVHFWDERNPEVAVIPTPPAIKEKQDEFNIIVLMNGEACKPMPRGKQIKNLTNQLEGVWIKAMPFTPTDIKTEQRLQSITFKPNNIVEWSYDDNGKKYSEIGNYEIKISRNIYWPSTKHTVLIIAPTKSTWEDMGDDYKDKLFLVGVKIDLDNRFPSNIKLLKFIDAFGHKYIFCKKE